MKICPYLHPKISKNCPINQAAEMEIHEIRDLIGATYPRAVAVLVGRDVVQLIAEAVGGRRRNVAEVVRFSDLVLTL
jgi:hypothetical protein